MADAATSSGLALLSPEEWVMLAMAVCPVVSLLEQKLEDYTEHRRRLCGCPWYTVERPQEIESRASAAEMDAAAAILQRRFRTSQAEKEETKKVNTFHRKARRKSVPGAEGIFMPHATHTTTHISSSSAPAASASTPSAAETKPSGATPAAAREKSPSGVRGSFISFGGSMKSGLSSMLPRRLSSGKLGGAPATSADLDEEIGLTDVYYPQGVVRRPSKAIFPI